MRTFLELDNVCLGFHRGAVNCSVEILVKETADFAYHQKIKDYENSTDYTITTACAVAREYFVMRERLWPDGSIHPFPMHVSQFLKIFKHLKDEEFEDM